ncbi:hypothetical protein Dda_2248 [Drechslerella dactyloides]|uniref:Uncharacterized protein n=1 Tax=Drechslerella dactyloides TaxID=74499 RepID=A0AAD6NM52_DREDA|nr:hypothetical protein Dda_2248 [Drechslerella dactyloides]
MVCEYAIFTFPDCGCPALVPVQYCPHHLDPSQPAGVYDTHPKTYQNPARITMLFKAPGVPLVHEDYMWLIKVYRDPFLRNGDYTEEEMDRLVAFREMLIEMQTKEIKLSDGTTVPTAGFHTKLCRYHVIWPDCKELRLWRVAEPFFPFLETRCFTHSNCIRTDNSPKGWGIYVQPVPERFKECFKQRFLDEYKKLQKEVEDGELAEAAAKEANVKPPKGVSDEAKKKTRNPRKKRAKKAKKIETLESALFGDTDSSEKSGDEGSEYKGSDGGESDSEDEPTVKAVQEEIKRAQGNTTEKIGKHKQQKNKSEKLKDTTTQEFTTKQHEKPKNAKKNAVKRKRNNNSDEEWKDVDNTDDSEKTVQDVKMTPRKRSISIHFDGQSIKKRMQDAIKKSIYEGEITGPHRSMTHEEIYEWYLENVIRPAKEKASNTNVFQIKETYRDRRWESDHSEPRSRAKPKKKGGRKARAPEHEDGDYEEESEDTEPEHLISRRNKRPSKKTNEEDSEYKEDASDTQIETGKQKAKRDTRGNGNKKALVRDLVRTSDTAMRIYRPAHDYHKTELLKNTQFDETELTPELRMVAKLHPEAHLQAEKEDLSTEGKTTRVGFSIDELVNGFSGDHDSIDN